MAVARTTMSAATSTALPVSVSAPQTITFSPSRKMRETRPRR